MQREKELFETGMVDTIKEVFRNKQVNIPDKYYILIADYVDCVLQLDYKDGLCLDPVKLVRSLPDCLTSISEQNIGRIYGRTDGSRITMSSNLDYESNKLYFFHELTHVLQTKTVNNQENCSFYNGHDGMFLTEGAVQFTAEILYHLSNGTNMQYKEQPNAVRGHQEHTSYSALSEYQLNGNILMLLANSLGIKINQLLALGYRRDGRQLLKELYEVFPGKAGKFEEFMFDLEKIYSIDKLIVAGYSNQLSGNPINIRMQDGRTFSGNIALQGQIITKIERELVAGFIGNNDMDYIMSNYKIVYNNLTTPQLKRDFMAAINELDYYSRNAEMSNNRHKK